MVNVCALCPPQWVKAVKICRLVLRSVLVTKSIGCYQGSQWRGWIPTEYLSTASASESFSSSYVSSQMTRARYLRDLYSCWWRHACKKHVMASTPVFIFLYSTDMGSEKTFYKRWSALWEIVKYIHTITYTEVHKISWQLTILKKHFKQKGLFTASALGTHSQ